MARFSMVFSPFKLKGVILSNRVVNPPFVVNYATEKGFVTDRLISYHRNIARGGAGLSIIGASAVSTNGFLMSNMTRINHDEYIPGLRDLCRVIEDEGSVPAIQLVHGGRQALPTEEAKELVAPSPIPCPVRQVVPRELSVEEIERIEDDFVNGAVRAKKAGAKMVELHGAHGYLINQFFSNWSNKRTDKYGGSLENRTRIVGNIMKKARMAVGLDYPIGIRVSAAEYTEGGLTLAESKEIAKILEGYGVDYIHVSAGVAASRESRNKAMASGEVVDMAKGIKEVVNVPIISVGKILDMERAEAILHQKKSDLVAMGRALVADPDLVRKVRDNLPEPINQCVECDECAYFLHDKPYMTCSVNPNL